MANLFETAQEFYQSRPQNLGLDKKRQLYTKELLLVIETAPFLTSREKSQMPLLIPLYSTSVIKKVKNSLIEQGITFLKMNQNDTKLHQWVQEVSKSK